MKIPHLIIISIVLISCQNDQEETSHEDADPITIETDTLANVIEPVAEDSDGNMLDIKFEEVTISIQDLDIKHVSEQEINMTHKDTAFFGQMPGSDCFMNKTIKISSSNFDKIEIFERMDDTEDWVKIEMIADNLIFKGGPRGCEMLKINLIQTATGEIIEKIIILEPSMTC